MLLLCAYLAQGAWAQFNVSGPGFTPDENGTNLDAPVQKQNPATGKVIKDCAECPEMVFVPTGDFMMGSSAQEQVLANAADISAQFTARENPQHHVKVPSFAVGRYAVTKGEFAVFVRKSGYRTEAEQGNGCALQIGTQWVMDAAYNWRDAGFAQSDDHPVVCVSWNDAQSCILWLNRISGMSFRLLSDAEREYATRGGTQTAFWWGESISVFDGNFGKLTGGTVPVNAFRPNQFGLYNVHGNVWEWVEDCAHTNYTGAPLDGRAWTTGCRSANLKRMRGGSWFNGRLWLRAAQLLENSSGYRLVNGGFRLARDL